MKRLTTSVELGFGLLLLASSAFAGADPCGGNASGTVTQGGWSVRWALTSSDGLEVMEATYHGREVLASAKVAEWHADYGNSGFVLTTGCAPTGGFPIYPYALPTVGEPKSVLGSGFSIEADFRMSNWGANCNYRFSQRLEFYFDGRIRIGAAAFGRGCGTNGTVRPLWRIDLNPDGETSESFLQFTSGAWQEVVTEQVLGPESVATDETEAAWRVLGDASGEGFSIVPSTGQFLDGGRGDDPSLYVLSHDVTEGVADLGAAVGGCCDDSVHGPESWINAESVEGENLVLWYVPSSEVDADPGSEYCWTVTGEPNPETYPCFTGPLLVPTTLIFSSSFETGGLSDWS